MSVSNHKNYSEYLNTRSKIGGIYRRFILYPRIVSHIKGNILDVGCGIGDFLKFYRNAVGVDVNQILVKKLKSEGMHVFHMDYNKIPFPDDSFDNIILDNVLEHIEDPRELLSEINRVLKLGGNFIIGVPCEKGFSYDDDHKRFYEINDLKKLLSENYILLNYFYTPPFLFFFRKVFRQVALYSIFKKLK